MFIIIHWPTRKIFLPVAFGFRPVLGVILGADSENVIGFSASGLVSEISSIL